MNKEEIPKSKEGAEEEKKMNRRRKKNGIRLTENDYTLMEELYYYHYLSFDIVKKIYDMSDRQIKHRLKYLIQDRYIVRFEVGYRGDDTHQIIYALGEGGFFCVTDFNTKEKFDIERTERLKKGYMHQVNSARILYAFSSGNEIEVFSEKKAYHFYGDDKNYHQVLRPDGAVKHQKNVIFIEYENTQKSRSLEQKIDRYEEYQRRGLIRIHPNMDDALKFQIIFVYNTKVKMENAIKKIEQLPAIQKLKIRATVLSDLLNNPLDQSIFFNVEYKGGNTIEKSTI